VEVFTQNKNNIADAILQVLSKQEIKDYASGLILPKKAYNKKEDDDIARVRTSYQKICSKLNLYNLRIRDVMFPEKSNKVKRKGIIEQMVNLQFQIDHSDDDDEESDAKSKDIESVDTSKSSRLSKKLKIGNLDEQYLVWSLDHYSQFTDGVITYVTLREVLKQCWFQDYTKIGVYDFQEGEMISPCGHYLIDKAGLPVVRFIPHKAYVPSDNDDIYVVGDMKVKPLHLDFNVREDREKYTSYCANLAKQKDMLMLGMNPSNASDVKKYDEYIESGEIIQPFYNDTIPKFRYKSDGMIHTYKNPDVMTEYLQHLCNPANDLVEFTFDIDNDDIEVDDKEVDYFTNMEIEVDDEEIVKDDKNDQDDNASTTPLSSLTGSIGEHVTNSKAKSKSKSNVDEVAKSVNTNNVSISDARTDNVSSSKSGLSFRNSYDMTGEEQDLYETPEWVITSLARHLHNIMPTNSLSVLDPCCGPTKVIGTILQEQIPHIIYSLMSTDKFYDNKIDFLEDIIEQYISEVNMVITNPPWGKKRDFLAKCYDDKKSFCLLLTIVTLGVASIQNYFTAYGVNVLILHPTPKFLHEGRELFTGPVAWFCYFIGMNPEIKVIYLQKE
jgi:hypothetical protein